MASQSETINKELIKFYKKDKIVQYLLLENKNKSLASEVLEKKADDFYKSNVDNTEMMKKVSDFVMVQYTNSYDFSTLYSLKAKAQRFKKKSFHIKDIKKVYSNIVSSYSFGIKTIKNKKDVVGVSDATGLFKIVFSDDTFMYYAKWISGFGKNRIVEGMFAAEGKVWYKFLKSMKQAKKKKSAPKCGIYRIFSTTLGLQYKELKDLMETPIVHKAVEEVRKDLDFYLNNVGLFTRYGMPGVRKIALVGPPGTGKSSSCIKLAQKYSKDYCVVFATCISDVSAHLMSCSYHGVGTIIILEDAESTLGNANASLLNFLDGVDQPKNLKGSYVIMTTNHPDRIEPRILKRPGRIDKIIEFNTLSGSYALACAQIYFDGILFNEKNKKDKKLAVELLKIINKQSGAAIKEIAQATASFAASENKTVDIDLIREVKQKMFDDLKNVEKYANEASNGKSLGFTNTSSQEPNEFTFEDVEAIFEFDN